MRHAPSAVLVMRIVADTNTALSGLLWLKTCPSESSKRSRSPGSAPSIRRSDKASALARPSGAANLGGRFSPRSAAQVLASRPVSARPYVNPLDGRA